MKVADNSKVFTYHGISLYPVRPGWLAVDQDGSLCWHPLKPQADTGCEWKGCGYWCAGGFSNTLVTVDLEGTDWKDTLVEVVSE